MFTVKNTFIECEDPLRLLMSRLSARLVSKEPPAEAALRAVHTAAGRLDMMWRDEEELKMKQDALQQHVEDLFWIFF